MLSFSLALLRDVDEMTEDPEGLNRQGAKIAKAMRVRTQYAQRTNAENSLHLYTLILASFAPWRFTSRSSARSPGSRWRRRR